MKIKNLSYLCKINNSKKLNYFGCIALSCLADRDERRRLADNPCLM